MHPYLNFGTRWQGGGGGGLFEPWTLSLRYFEKIDSLSGRLKDDVKIMGYAWKCCCWGWERVVTPFNMVNVFRFFSPVTLIFDLPVIIKHDRRIENKTQTENK